MNTTQIRSFLVAAETCNFTKAANRLFTTQPVISRQIMSLEAEIGIILFSRNCKAVQLSPAGAAFAEGIAKIMTEVDDLIEHIRTKNWDDCGMLRIGNPIGRALTTWQETSVRDFMIEHPQIKVTLINKNIQKLFEYLDDELIDLFFSTENEIQAMSSNSNYSYCVMPPEHFSLVLPRNHPLLKKKELHLIDLKNECFISLPENQCGNIRSIIRDACLEVGFEPTFLDENSVELFMIMVETGKGISLLPSNRNIPTTLVPVEVSDLPTLSPVAVYSSANQSVALKMFLDMVGKKQQ